jgi:hypothetical protein
VPDEVPMAEAMMADEAVAMADEAGVPEAVSTEVAHSAATSTKVHAAAAATDVHSAAAAATMAAHTTAAATSAELVFGSRLRLHRIDA